MSEMIMEHMGMIEAAVERLDQEKRDEAITNAAITNALSYAQGFAAGMMVRDAEKEKKGA